MRQMLLILTLVAGLAATVAPTAGAADTVTVTLEVTPAHHALPAYKSCDVTVPAGANAGDVLDQAADDGCIDSWEYATFPGFGRYVTCIDDVCEAGVHFWAFFVNAAPSDVGIDDYAASTGDVVEFVYADWFTPFLP